MSDDLNQSQPQSEADDPNSDVATELSNAGEMGSTTDGQELPDPIKEVYQTSEFQDKWKEELESSRKELKDFHKTGNKTIERYIDKRQTDNIINDVSHFNLFYANTEYKAAALYANQPDPSIKTRFDEPDDNVSRVAATILYRNIIVELDEEMFDCTARGFVNDRLVPGVGFGWVRYEQEGGDEEAHPQAGQQFIDPVTRMPSVHPQTITSPITKQCSPVDYVPWDDILWSPCRIWSQCRWVARRIPMDKDAIQERFGKSCPQKTLDNLSYEKTKSPQLTSPEQKILPQHNIDKTCDVYECWDKQRGMIWSIAEGADVPLDVVEDTNNYDGFFPTPLPPLGRFSTSNTVPVSDFYLAQDLYNQIDSLNNRIARLINAMVFKFVYDSQAKGLQDLYTTTNELQGIPVDNWASFMSERGGLTGAIQTTASIMDQQADALQKLMQARDSIKEQIDQIEGISDIMKGEGVANETRLQTATKSAFGTSRLSITQEQIACYVASLFRLKAQLMCKFYSPQILLQRAGTFSQADQQFVQQALQLLKDKQMRHFKLTVSTDTLQLPNWNLEKQERTDAFKAIAGSVGQMGPMFQQYPHMAPFMLKLVRWLVAGYKGSDTITGDLDTAVQQFTSDLQKAGNNKPPSPQQAEAQTKQAQTQADVQIAQGQEQTKRLKIQTEAQTASQQQKIDEQQVQVEAAKVQTRAQSMIHDQAHNHAMDYATMGNDNQPAVAEPPSGKPDLTIIIGGPSHPGA